jgi:hypothetical protein
MPIPKIENSLFLQEKATESAANLFIVLANFRYGDAIKIAGAEVFVRYFL